MSLGELRPPSDRPENILGFLMRTGIGNRIGEQQLMDAIATRREKAEHDSRPISGVEALAYIFLETGRESIQAISNEQTHNLVLNLSLAPTGFDLLSEKDKIIVRNSYAALLTGLLVLSMTEVMETGEVEFGRFDRPRFLSRYNEAVRGTRFQGSDLKELWVPEHGIERGDDEIISYGKWEELRDYYDQYHVADFYDMWFESLPDSLLNFIEYQEMTDDVKAMLGEFHKRAMAIPILEIPEAFRKVQSYDFEKNDSQVDDLDDEIEW